MSQSTICILITSGSTMPEGRGLFDSLVWLAQGETLHGSLPPELEELQVLAEDIRRSGYGDGGPIARGIAKGQGTLTRYAKAVEFTLRGGESHWATDWQIIPPYGPAFNLGELLAEMSDRATL